MPHLLSDTPPAALAAERVRRFEQFRSELSPEAQKRLDCAMLHLRDAFRDRAERAGHRPPQFGDRGAKELVIALHENNIPIFDRLLAIAKEAKP